MSQPTLEHDAFFYETDEGFVSALAPFLREGLERDHTTVVATSRARIGLLQDTLADDAAAVRFLPHDDWYTRPGAVIAAWRQLLDESTAEGRPYTRLIGEVRFGDTEAEWASWTRYEGALNAAFRRQPAWIVCPYDLRSLPESVVEEARRTHPTVWEDARRPSDDYQDPAALLERVPEPIPGVEAHPVLHLEIPDGLASVRRAVTAASAGRLSPTRRDDLVLVANEVATNALRHGAGVRRLRVWTLPDGVLCEVTDEGEASPHPLAGYVPPDRLAERGHGLWVARRLCDALSVASTTAGTSVRFVVRG